jgi:hypothetical protein
VNKTIGAIIALEILLTVGLFRYQPKIPLQTSVAHDLRRDAIIAFMRKSNFAPDQYQYVTEIIKDADANKIPAAFLICVDLQESSGGKRYYRSTHNPFGWGSDQISFETERIAIDYISRQLGGGHFYAGKSIEGKLHAYNPNPEYAIKIINCINNVNKYQNGLPTRP